MAYSGPHFAIRLKSGHPLGGQVTATDDKGNHQALPTIERLLDFLNNPKQSGAFLRVQTGEGVVTIVAKDAIERVDPHDPDVKLDFSGFRQ